MSCWPVVAPVKGRWPLCPRGEGTPEEGWEREEEVGELEVVIPEAGETDSSGVTAGWLITKRRSSSSSSSSPGVTSRGMRFCKVEKNHCQGVPTLLRRINHTPFLMWNVGHF